MPKLTVQIVMAVFLTIFSATTGMSQTNFFNDTFVNGSTVDSATPAAPTTNSASYEIISSKGWNPTASVTSLGLKFGIASSASGTTEAEAMFATNPITLTSNSDYVTLSIVFKDVSGPLTAGAGFLGIGLYNTGASTNYPVPSGLNGTATTSNTGNALNNAVLWEGYFGLLSYSGGNDSLNTRPIQTTSTTDAGQDVCTTGSGSESFQYPKGSGIGSTVLSSLVLSSNTEYTEVFTIALTNASMLGITNSIYEGTDTTAAPLAQYNGTASGSTFLTSGFNALAFGLNSKSTNAVTGNVLDLVSINISGQSTTIMGPPNPTQEPANVIVVTNGYAQLSVVASGFNIIYQWYRNGVLLANGGDLSGVTTPTLVIDPSTMTDAVSVANGYYCVLTGAGNYTTNTVTNSLALVAATNLVWVGTTPTATWDVDNSVDWETTNSSPVPAVFTGGDPVSFNDNTVVNASVTLAGNVAPASMSVTTANAFTFSGSGSIAGNGYAVFDGENQEGEVQLNANNTYSGGTLLTNGVLVNLENYAGLGSGPVILGSATAQMEIDSAGSATVGINGDVDVASNFTFLVDGTGSYATVFFGNFLGSSAATLTFEPAIGINPSGTAANTNRVRLYGTNTVCNANIFIDGPSTEQAQYNGCEIAFYNATGTQKYNGVISGDGGVIQRGTGIAILDGQNTYTGGTTPTAGDLGVGANSEGATGSGVTSGPLGTGALLLAPEVPNTTATGEIFASAPNITIGNSIVYPSGTNNLTLEIGGTNNLTLSGPFALNGADGSGISGGFTSRTFQVTNTGLTTLSGVMTDGGLGYGFNLTGSGTLALNNTNTYTGPTVISGGTLLVNGRVSTNTVTVATNGALGGGGVITGPVTIQAGGTLAPGNPYILTHSVLTLTISNILTLQAGSTNIAVVTQGGVNSLVTGLTSVAYNGTLVPNIVGTLRAGQNFTIFSAAAYTGNFSAIAGTPGAGLVWAFNPTNGVLSVVQSTIIPNVPPQITSFSFVGGNLSISGTNGVNGGTYYLLGTTNLTTPIGQWIPVATNVVTASGGTESFSFTGTNAYTAGAPGWFFRLSSTNN